MLLYLKVHLQNIKNQTSKKSLMEHILEVQLSDQRIQSCFLWAAYIYLVPDVSSNINLNTMQISVNTIAHFEHTTFYCKLAQNIQVINLCALQAYSQVAYWINRESQVITYRVAVNAWNSILCCILLYANSWYPHLTYVDCLVFRPPTKYYRGNPSALDSPLRCCRASSYNCRYHFISKTNMNASWYSGKTMPPLVECGPHSNTQHRGWSQC
jgi:hypothetical protein